MERVFFILSLSLFLFLPFLCRAEAPFEEAYDLNTELVISGEIKRINLPPKGIVFIEIERNNKVFIVYLAPKWYYDQLEKPLKEGDWVEIKGSKIYTKRHGLIFVAKSIKDLKSKREIFLRGRCCEPLWKKPKGCPYHY